jgi:hypothetical protein
MWVKSVGVQDTGVGCSRTGSSVQGAGVARTRDVRPIVRCRCLCLDRGLMRGNDGCVMRRGDVSPPPRRCVRGAVWTVSGTAIGVGGASRVVRRVLLAQVSRR